jgi:hypothetical protein
VEWNYSMLAWLIYVHLVGGIWSMGDGGKKVRTLTKGKKYCILKMETIINNKGG